MRSIVVFGIAGLISGILSSAIFSLSHSLSLAILPGAIFGFTLVCAVWISEWRVVNLAGSLIFIPAAGIIYLISAIPIVALSAAGAISDSAPICGSGLFGCVSPIGVGFAGALGALLLSFAFALVYPRIRLMNSLYLTIFGGVLAALGAVVATTKDPAFFFIIWQTVMALGFGMTVKEHQELDLKKAGQVVG